MFSSLLQTNTSVASSLGTYFLSQITLIFLDMLNVYRYQSSVFPHTCPFKVLRALDITANFVISI